MAEKNLQYLDVVANAFKTAQAWKMAALLLGATTAFLAYTVVHQANLKSVVLIPYDLAAAGGNATVALDGSVKGTSFEYMSTLAIADLSLILNYTPETAVQQTLRFINRTTPTLAGQQESRLKADAEKRSREATTQSFYPSKITVAEDSSKVTVTGYQVRWAGGQETLRTPVTYNLSYQHYKDYFHVSELTQEQNDKK